MMFDRAYRQRLEADLARWEAAGVITPPIGTAIRAALPPLAPGVTLAVVIAIVGGLLIAAAFLAFVAAHWTELTRLLRLALLFAGIVVAHGLGGWFARTNRPLLSDLCASVGSIIFGAGIALVGQMYHLGGDFAGGMLLWTIGALLAAALTGSRGTLAVALMAASIWSNMRVIEVQASPHLPFLIVWLMATGLALAWNSRVAAHLISLAILPWWIGAATFQSEYDAAFVLSGGAALLLGGGLALAATPWQRVATVGGVLSVYGAFSLAAVAIGEVATTNESFFRSVVRGSSPLWAIGCGFAGSLLALTIGSATRRAGTALVGIAIAFVLVATVTWTQPRTGEPWLLYAFYLCGMVCLVVSGILDGARPRIVAGWLGIAGVIASITWAVKGSLLGRSVFLAAAGAVSVALALLLKRLVPRSEQ